MKKFLSNIMFATVAIISATGFTSCNNADDPYVPTPQSTAQQPKLDYVPVYELDLSEDILNLYDITLVLHSGDKSKESILEKTNGTAFGLETVSGKATYYKFFCSEIDGNKGIDYVEAKVTPKADIKTTLESKPAEMFLTDISKAQIYKAVYDENGKQIGEMGIRNGDEYSFFTPSEMLEQMEDGTLKYDLCAQILAEHLTRKK